MATDKSVINEMYQYFISKLGEPSSYIVVPESAYGKYRDILPESFLSFWQQYGWSPFANGLFWLTNPDDYADTVQEWLKDIPEFKDSKCYVFARSAFGDLYAFQPDTTNILSIICVRGGVIADKEITEPKDKDLRLANFLVGGKNRSFDLKDDSGNSLFNQAFEKFGMLAENEIYGLQPFLVLGGSPSIDNIQKVRMDVHLDIMRQFTEPQLYLV